MPDLERRSSASFISSKEGGTPASLSRSLMKRSSSNCFRVSIEGPRLPLGEGGEPNPDSSETNHERTLYVRYMFRNPLIKGEHFEMSEEGLINRRVEENSRANQPRRQAQTARGQRGNRRPPAAPASRNP